LDSVPEGNEDGAKLRTSVLESLSRAPPNQAVFAELERPFFG
jgi:hypothetical protein